MTARKFYIIFLFFPYVSNLYSLPSQKGYINRKSGLKITNFILEISLKKIFINDKSGMLLKAEALRINAKNPKYKNT